MRISSFLFFISFSLTVQRLGHINRKGVNFRSLPSIEGKKLGVFYHYDKVYVFGKKRSEIILGEKHNWYLVKTLEGKDNCASMIRPCSFHFFLFLFSSILRIK